MSSNNSGDSSKQQNSQPGLVAGHAEYAKGNVEVCPCPLSMLSSFGYVGNPGRAITNFCPRVL